LQIDFLLKKESDRSGIPMLWWPSVAGGKNGDKHRYVEKQYVQKTQGKGDFVYCLITDTETAMSYASGELKTRKGKEYWLVYKCRKLVSQTLLRGFWINSRASDGPIA